MRRVGGTVPQLLRTNAVAFRQLGCSMRIIHI